MNTNCLAGMKCPECGSEGPFRIDVLTTVTMYDDGWSENVSDTIWEDDSGCSCDACDYGGEVCDFKVDSVKNSEGSSTCDTTSSTSTKEAS